MLGSTFYLRTENARLVPQTGHVLECVEGVAPVIEANLPHGAFSACEWQLLGRKGIVEPPRAPEFLEALKRGHADPSADRKSLAIWSQGWCCLTDRA